MNRTTFLIGAGAPLDLDLPEGVIKPSTYNITQEVIKPYENTLHKTKDIHIVEDVYYRLIATYPRYGFIRPDITFEQVFHVLEMLWSYGMVWKRECNNPKMFPPFAPFTDVTKDLTIDYSLISSSVFHKFIERVMNIIDGYDKEFRANIEKHKWYKDFFVHFGCEKKGDFFNLNYDTTIEESIKGNFVDGYEDVKSKQPFQRFNPKKLFDKTNNQSTINHLHGCINYYFSTNKNPNEDIYLYRDSDLYKYFDYDIVNHEMSRWFRSTLHTQACDSYYPSPIITGLRKTDKLNCIPFDFYHANLINCIINSPRLVIIGYGFGDSYCNQILERMNLLHGDKRRIVLIDYWNKEYYDKIKSARYDMGDDLVDDKWGFLWREMHRNGMKEATKDLFPIEPNDECDSYEGYRKIYDDKDVLRSKNGCVMILPHGFKDATNYIDEIDEFLGHVDK